MSDPKAIAPAPASQSSTGEEFSDEGIRLLLATIPSADPPGAWQPPEVADLRDALPQYEIQAFVARGGMGAVYRGVQRSLDREVAIKVLPPNIAGGGAHYAERFRNEAKVMARLSQPNIVAVYDSGETADGLLYIAMEFVEGTSVQQLIAAHGRIEPRRAAGIALALLDALAFAHQNGIVHRDIKPSNIMLDSRGGVKVADFGLAKVLALETGFTGSDVILGTRDFAAPEMTRLGTKVDGRADLYAAGVTLYLMLTGCPPRGCFEPPSTLVPGIDPRFDEIVNKALQPDPARRYSSAAGMRHAVERCLVDPRARRHRGALTMVALAGLALLAGVASYRYHQPRKAANPASAVGRPAGDARPSVTQGKPSPVFSSFIPNAPWRDRMADSTEWGPAWKKSGTEWHVQGETARQTFAPKSSNGAIRVRFRTQQEKAFLDLILRNQTATGNQRYSVTLWTAPNFSAIDLVHPQGNSPHIRLARLAAHPPIRAGEEHCAEFYAVGDQFTFFLDGVLLASTRDPTFTEGDTLVWAREGIELMGVETAVLDGLAPQTASGIVDRVGWTSLLAGVDIARDSVMSPWIMEKGVLRSPPNPVTADSPKGHQTLLFRIPHAPRKYDLRYRLTRTEPGFTIALPFIRDGEPAALLIDGGNGFTLDHVNKRVAPVRTQYLPPGTTHEILIEVREDRVRASLDGQVQSERAGKLHDHQTEAAFYPAEKVTPPVFGIAICSGQMTVHAADFREVGKDGAPLLVK